MAENQFEISKIMIDGIYQGSYTHIPWEQVRHTADKLFPDVAVNKLADSASGLHHRWKEGHDLFVDVIGDTLPNKGINEAFQQAQHILLTDFPTKAGIPIPGFSHSGLGQYLVDIGIPKGYLSVNLLDTGIGIFAISDSATNLISAMHSDLAWGTMTAFNTFGIGTVEISAGLATQNPLLIVSGGGNIAAGSISYHDYCITPHVFDVALDTLLMSFGGSFLIGGVVSYLINMNQPNEVKFKSSIFNAIKSGSISTIMTINTTIGFSFVGVMALIYTSKVIAEQEQQFQKLTFAFNPLEYLNLIKEYTYSNGEFYLNADFIDDIDDKLKQKSLLNVEPHSVIIK